MRYGNFTSSGIGALMKVGKGEGLSAPARTYIDEKNMERRLNRSLNTEISAKPLNWGNLCELQAFEKLGLEYTLVSRDVLTHPDIDYWRGTPDGMTDDTVYDIKCPWTLKSFCQFADCETIAQVVLNHKDGPKYQWQLISNAVLTGKKYAELIIYCPYLAELQEIRELAMNYPGEDQYKYWFIANSRDEELPYLPEGCQYKHIHKIRFEVTEEMKQSLTARVLEAGKYLIGEEKESPKKRTTNMKEVDNHEGRDGSAGKY